MCACVSVCVCICVCESAGGDIGCLLKSGLSSKFRHREKGFFCFLHTSPRQSELAAVVQCMHLLSRQEDMGTAPTAPPPPYLHKDIPHSVRDEPN